MTDCAKPHAGIELDLIDLSQTNTQFSFPGRSNLKKDKIDYKTFVKHISEKILENESFVSFSNQFSDMNNILKMKYSSAGDIADVISRDGILTAKLLKLVNSSFYDQFSHKTITTISEAMIILGTEEIKLAATTLKIHDLMQNIATIKILKVKALKALQRSMIARQIAFAEGIKDAKNIQISAMLYDFGEYIVALFLPDVFIRIELWADENSLSREKVSKFITGISYSDLGRFVASKWNLPTSVLHAMKPFTEFDGISRRLTQEDRHRIICTFSNELCNIEFSLDEDNVRKKIDKISGKYKDSLNISPSKSLELFYSGDTLLNY